MYGERKGVSVMISTPQSREELLRRLVAIPSVTESAHESDAAAFVYEHLAQLRYFRENPAHIAMIPCDAEGSPHPPHVVIARMMAPVPTPKTVVFIAHYDVVDTSAYGDLREHAFDPDALARLLDPQEIGPRAAADLASGNYIFGRGIMDMKCGLALEMELLRDYDDDRGLFDVNIVVAAVPDEENTGNGMRRAARCLAELKRACELEYIAGIDTEPSEPGLPDAPNQLIFLGSMGKLLPSFYCRGVASHVGNYYFGLSAALLAAHIVTTAEASPDLADPSNGACQPSWICLENTLLKEQYSVTIPNRAVCYFNCFVTANSPAKVLRQMRTVAQTAASRTADQLARSHAALARMGYAPSLGAHLEAPVLTYADIFDRAAAQAGGADALRRRTSAQIARMPKADMREVGIAVLEEWIQTARIEPPFVAVGFLPPYNPQISSLDGRPKSNALVHAMTRVAAEARDRFDTVVDTAEFFAGISDMSFLGLSVDPDDVRQYPPNCPGWGDLYTVPFEAMREIDMPVANIGPCGYDAHRKSERLDRRYSLEILPHLLVTAVRALSEEYSCTGPTPPESPR